MLRFRIEGLVQGVGYRAFAVRRARAHGLTGAVRNESDGTVTLVARGDDDRLDRLRLDLESGPPAARVSRVTAMALPPGAGERFDFEF